MAAFRQRFTREQFSWDSKTGEVTIGGERIADSNITDLISALLLTFQKTNLKGLNQLITLLKETNFPVLLIRNTKIRQSLISPAAPPEKPIPETPVNTVEKLIPAKKPRVWLKW